MYRIMSKPSLYDFTVTDTTGAEVSLSSYSKTPVVLIVNVACKCVHAGVTSPSLLLTYAGLSRCGYTSQNYKELADMYDKYKDRGFIVLVRCLLIRRVGC